MRIAQVMLGKGFGGAERSFVDLCHALTRRGHNVLAICESRGAALAQLSDGEGLDIKALTVRGPWDVLARRRLRTLLRTFDPAVAQMHLARASTLAGPAARSLGIPTLAKTHNYINLKYYAAIDHLVTTTEKQRAYLSGKGVAQGRLSVIPNFSSVPVIAPARAAGGSPLRALAIGRFVHKKGFDLLIAALANVRERGVDVTLALAGDGPDSDALHDEIDELGLKERVRFLGWQDNVVPCFADADVFVLPSRDEPFGIVCLEAMACGVPIIATATDGPATFLDETTAILVPPGDPAALAEAIARIAADRPAAEARAVAASERFASRYSEDIVVAQYLALYDRLTA